MTSFTQDTAPTQYAEGGGIRFAYRRFGIPERPPLVFFQHFMGTLDDHDPALSDAFARNREVILFNNTGVASSSGIVPGSIEAMARDAISFTGALGLTTIDVVVSSRKRVKEESRFRRFGVLAWACWRGRSRRVAGFGRLPRVWDRTGTGAS